MSEHATSEPRWRRLPEERPKQILDAALAVFGEHGLAGARLDDIAKRAGLSKGTIYLYFPNKEELFREVVRDTVIARSSAASTNSSASAIRCEALDAFMAGYWTFIRSAAFAPMFRLIHAEIHNFPDLARVLRRRGRRTRRSGSSAGSSSAAWTTGEFRRIDPLGGRAHAQRARSSCTALWCTIASASRPIANIPDEQCSSSRSAISTSTPCGPDAAVQFPARLTHEPSPFPRSFVIGLTLAPRRTARVLRSRRVRAADVAADSTLRLSLGEAARLAARAERRRRERPLARARRAQARVTQRAPICCRTCRGARPSGAPRSTARASARLSERARPAAAARSATARSSARVNVFDARAQA